MTAVLGTFVRNMPILVGDAIESMPDHAAPAKIYVPTTGVTELPASRSSLRNCGLVQKLAVLGSNLAIAWSGNVTAAKHVLEAIRDANNITPFDGASLTRYLDRDVPSVINGQVGLICLLQNSEAGVMFSRNAQCVDDAVLGPVFVDGSGSEALIQQLRGFVAPEFTAESPWHDAVSVAAAFTGTLLFHESHHAHSLRENFGGAYEIATTGKGGISKLEDVMYVQWFGELRGDAFSLLPSRIFRYGYQSDVLVVRTISWSREGGGTIQSSDTYTLIPSVLRDLTPQDMSEAQPPSLCAPLVSHQITLKGPAGEVLTFNRNDFGCTGAFEIVETSLPHGRHGIEVRIANHFMAQTRERLEAILRQAT